MGQRKPFLLRIDPALWAELEAWAQAELRSANGQIEWVLKQAIERRKGTKPGARTSIADPAGGTGQGQSESGGEE